MSWRKQEAVNLVMWKSKRSGATLSDLRKTDKGRDKLVSTLLELGYPPEDIVVVKQEKAWKLKSKGVSK